MSSSLAKKTADCHRETKVRKLSPAEFGRTEIRQAEANLPGLMSCRTLFSHSLPFKNAKIVISRPITTVTAVYTETLISLGAEVRCCSSTEDHVTAAIARDSPAVFAWKGQTNTDPYWSCIEKAIDWKDGPNLIIEDNNGDITLLINEGVKAEEMFEKTGQLPNPTSMDDEAIQTMLAIIRDSVELDPKKYTKMKERLAAFPEEIATGINGLVYRGQPPRVNDNSIFLLEGLMMATDFNISGKTAAVVGYGEVARNCVAALKQGGARVVVMEDNPKNILFALAAGLDIVTPDDQDNIISKIDIFVTAKGNKNPAATFTVALMRKVKDNAILCNMGESDGEIDMVGLEKFPGVNRTTIKPQIDNWVFSDTNSGVIILAEGRPLANSSSSFSDQMIADVLLGIDGQEETRMMDLMKEIKEDERTIENLQPHIEAIEAYAVVSMVETMSPGRDETRNWVAAAEVLNSELGRVRATVRLASEVVAVKTEETNQMVATILDQFN